MEHALLKEKKSQARKLKSGKGWWRFLRSFFIKRKRVNQDCEHKGESITPGEGSITPGELSITPGEQSITQGELSETPGELSAISCEFSATLGELNITPCEPSEEQSITVGHKTIFPISTKALQNSTSSLEHSIKDLKVTVDLEREIKKPTDDNSPALDPGND